LVSVGLVSVGSAVLGSLGSLGWGCGFWPSSSLALAGFADGVSCPFASPPPVSTLSHASAETNASTDSNT
jgi:hypothetical protein